MIKQFLVSLIATTIIMFLTGCGAKSPQPPATATPVVISNFDGYAGGGRWRTQTFTAAPKRVLAVSEPVTDDLIFLGVDDRIAAVSACYAKSFAPYEKQYAKLHRLTLGSGYPSKEAVLELNPDLIVSWGSLFGDSALGSVKYWQQRGIHTYVMTNTVPVKASGKRRVKNIVTDLRNLARIFRVEEQNRERLAQLEQRINGLQKAASSKPASSKPRIVTLQYLYGNEYFGRTRNDLTADMIELAGGVSLDDEIGGRKSIEYLMQLNPDIIIVIDTANLPVERKLDALRQHKVLHQLKAVKDGRFYVIRHREFYCGSLLTVEAVEGLKHYIEADYPAVD